MAASLSGYRAKIGIPQVADLNDLDEDIGMSTSPVNILDGVRWNTAFAYLDPSRQSIVCPSVDKYRWIACGWRATVSSLFEAIGLQGH